MDDDEQARTQKARAARKEMLDSISKPKRHKTEHYEEEYFDDMDANYTNLQQSQQSQTKGKGEKHHSAPRMHPYPTSQHSRQSQHDQSMGLHSIRQPGTNHNQTYINYKQHDRTTHEANHNNHSSSAFPPPSSYSQHPQHSQQANTQTNQKGKGKGKIKGYTIPHNGELQDLVEFTRRSCIRTMELQRQTQREQNFVMEIPNDNQEIREGMLSLIDNYKNERPTSGPHPLGNLHDILWFYISEKWTQFLETQDTSDFDPETTRYQKRTQTFINNSFKETGRRGTILNHFRIMGPRNKAPPQGNWYYSIKISNTTQQARNQHELLQELIDDSQTEHKLHTGFGPSIRNDYGSMDTLERTLRDFKLS